MCHEPEDKLITSYLQESKATLNEIIVMAEGRENMKGNMSECAQNTVDLYTVNNRKKEIVMNTDLKKNHQSS